MTEIRVDFYMELSKSLMSASKSSLNMLKAELGIEGTIGRSSESFESWLARSVAYLKALGWWRYPGAEKQFERKVEEFYSALKRGQELDAEYERQHKNQEDEEE